MGLMVENKGLNLTFDEETLLYLSQFSKVSVTVKRGSQYFIIDLETSLMEEPAEMVAFRYENGDDSQELVALDEDAGGGALIQAAGNKPAKHGSKSKHGD